MEIKDSYKQVVDSTRNSEEQKTLLEQHVSQMVVLTHQLEGHLTDKEVRFLSVAPFLQGTGEILEIGSFKGKSTIILAKSAIRAGYSKVHACDPHLLPFIKKEDLTDLFFNNLSQYSVLENVEFHQMKSTELSESWEKPLRLLWIDGDHTYRGALADFNCYRKFLVPGAIVCLHDVLHEDEGPIRVFAQEVLLSESFGDCGICGSIAWGQFLGERSLSQQVWSNKLTLYKKLSRLIPYVVAKSHGMPVSKILFKILRELVPHGEIDPDAWLIERNEWQSK
jgi:predicted O-methyltransferase YrrM